MGGGASPASFPERPEEGGKGQHKSEKPDWHHQNGQDQAKDVVAHDILEQAANAFRKIWPEVTVGMYEGGTKDTTAYVICGSIQSIAQNLEDFSPDEEIQMDEELELVLG